MKKLLALCMVLSLMFSTNVTAFASEETDAEEPYHYSFVIDDGQVVSPRTVLGGVVIDYPATSKSMTVSGMATRVGFTFVPLTTGAVGTGTIYFTKNSNVKQVRVGGSYSLPVDGNYHSGDIIGVGNYLTRGTWVVNFTSSIPVNWLTLSVGD